MAVTIDRVAPVAHLPLVLGVLRKLEIATLVDSMIPAHDEQVVSAGRAVEALVLSILDGHHALYKVGRRLDERGMLPLLQPGLEPQSLHDTRLGQTLDALFDANLHEVFSAIALRALDIYQIGTPWIHQDTTTISFYGTYEDDRDDDKGPRPTYGYSKDGRGDLKQVLLSLGVSGDGGLPLRMGLHDGNRSDTVGIVSKLPFKRVDKFTLFQDISRVISPGKSHNNNRLAALHDSKRSVKSVNPKSALVRRSHTVDVPQAIEQSVALGLDGLHGIVADSKAYTPRTLGLCRETGMGLVTLVPRTCAIRQEVETWGQKQVSLPLLLEKPGKRRSDAPRRWYGRSVTRQVEVEDGEGQVTWTPMRFVAVHSTQLAQRHAEAHAHQQRQEAKSLATHLAQVQCRQFACQADAEGAIATYEGRGSGQRGRPATRWRYHEVRYEVESRRQRQKRTQRGRPRKGEEPQEDIVYQLKVTTQALAAPVATFGWLVLATTIDASICGDAEIVRAYRDQTTTVERGFRWMKNPAAIHPVWLEKRERIAALAMLTVVGLLVYGLIQRQVRQYLQAHEETIPGNKGETNMPTATVIFESFTTLSRVEFRLDGTTVNQFHGWQGHHERVFRALGLVPISDDELATQKNHLTRRKGP